MFWFWLLIIMILLLVALLPPWPYMRERDLGYWPSGVALAVILLLLFLWWIGWVAVWSPWHVPVVR